MATLWMAIGAGMGATWIVNFNAPDNTPPVVGAA